MFSVSTLEDIVRIPPNLFGTSLNKAAINILKSKYESMVKSDLGYIIMILNADVFFPKLQEIIYGELVDITDFGAFVRIGPTDALLHLSQVMDDYLKSNIASGVILANQSGRTLKIGSTIRTRITAVSLGKASTMGKIGITCRQPFLGAEEWIQEDLKKASGADEGEEKVEDKKEEKVEAKKEKKEEKVEAE